ncbi:hypothetical protein LTR28_005631 [Elasticomyces elasticus]|nr:hypothetical protein LTR28_005631 [Elasticomyces elasticus]
MASTTPTSRPPPSDSHTRPRSTSRSRLPPRPTTPLRPPSRTPLRGSTSKTPLGPSGAASSAVESLEPGFAELSDSMADLEANLMHLSLLNESLGRFNECFGSFLYGMQASAFCVDFPEAPIPDSFKRTRAHQPVEAQHTRSDRHPRDSHNTNTINDNNDPEATFLTSDTSFIENPPTSSRPASRFTGPSAPIPPGRMGSLRGGASSAAGRGARGGAAAGGTTRAGSSGRARGGARAPR